MKDIQTWNELTAEVARLERENAELRGSRIWYEICDDVNGYVIIALYETSVVADYCPSCGRRLEDKT